MSLQQIARTLCMSYAWVLERLKLLDLDPEVQKLMHPSRNRDQRLAAKTAAFIANNVGADKQLDFAREVIERGWSMAEAGRRYRLRTGHNRYGGGSGRKRVPADERRFIQTRMSRVLTELELLKGIAHRLGDFYATAPNAELERHLRELKRIGQLARPIWDELKRIHEGREQALARKAS